MASPKKQHLTPLEEEYMMKYGDLPSDEEGLLLYAREHYPFTAKQMDAAMERCDGVGWKGVQFVLYLVPKPSPRPHYDGNHFYVKGAAANRKLIKKFIERNIIYTRAEILIEAYLPTPKSSMNHAEIYLAEAKKIVPVGNCDVDNLMKTYMDMIQGQLLLNDNIVTMGKLEKFYSLKPRMFIEVRYQDGFDSHYNERRITATKAYKEEFGADRDKKES
jgi:Holliday junction resolvase RusA-like endonuclease